MYYFYHIIDKLILFYIYVNTIIECDYLHKPEKWGYLNTFCYFDNLFSTGEFFDFIPIWAKESHLFCKMPTVLGIPEIWKI